MAPRVETPPEEAPAPVVPIPPSTPAPAEVVEEAAPIRRSLEARPSESADAEVTVAPPQARTSPLTAPYGSRDGQLFGRTRNDGIVLLPVARLELDARALQTTQSFVSDRTLSVALTRLEVGGWVGGMAAFAVGSDFASGPSLRRADNYVAVAPWGDRAILQLGQFNVPFSLANRTADRYLDFGDRGVAVQAFALPDHKDQGVMLQGMNAARNFYYSAAVLNGEGPQVTGVDGRVDVVARAWAAPFSFNDPELLRDITVGGSVWTGDRSMKPAFLGQKTPGGYAILHSGISWTNGASSPVELRQHGRLAAVGLELNAPIAHRFGFRFEWIAKRQALAAVDLADASRPSSLGGLSLSGWATYAEVWAWVLGDDRVLGAPAAVGLDLPVRLRDLRVDGAPRGVLLAARLERLDETVSDSASTRSLPLGIASVGATRVTSAALSASYWYTRRARVMLGYAFHSLSGTTPYVAGLSDKNVHEILLRTALAL
jgi:hypothetical protein